MIQPNAFDDTSEHSEQNFITTSPADFPSSKNGYEGQDFISEQDSELHVLTDFLRKSSNDLNNACKKENMISNNHKALFSVAAEYESLSIEKILISPKFADQHPQNTESLVNKNIYFNNNLNKQDDHVNYVNKVKIFPAKIQPIKVQIAENSSPPLTFTGRNKQTEPIDSKGKTVNATSHDMKNKYHSPAKRINEKYDLDLKYTKTESDLNLTSPKDLKRYPKTPSHSKKSSITIESNKGKPLLNKSNISNKTNIKTSFLNKTAKQDQLEYNSNIQVEKGKNNNKIRSENEAINDASKKKTQALNNPISRSFSPIKSKNISLPRSPSKTKSNEVLETNISEGIINKGKNKANILPAVNCNEVHKEINSESIPQITNNHNDNNKNPIGSENPKERKDKEFYKSILRSLKKLSRESLTELKDYVSSKEVNTLTKDIKELNNGGIVISLEKENDYKNRISELEQQVYLYQKQLSKHK